MNLALFATALVMTVVALAFATTPLIATPQRRSAGSVKLSLLGIIVVFGMGIALYGVIGQPELGNVRAEGPTSGMNAASSQESEKVGSVTSLLDGLETRLANNPDDAKGWLLLAKSYDHLGRSTDAKTAYEKAAALGITDAALAVRLENGVPATTSSGAEIRGHVSVAAAAADRVSPNDVVYIVAKTNNNPMPLAVLRRSAAELPFDFVLNDENSMVQGGGISSASTVTISARISRTGDALNTASELGAISAAIKPTDNDDLALVIDVTPES